MYGEISTLHITSEMQGFDDFAKVESRDALSVSIMQCLIIKSCLCLLQLQLQYNLFS